MVTTHIRFRVGGRNDSVTHAYTVTHAYAVDHADAIADANAFANTDTITDSDTVADTDCYTDINSHTNTYFYTDTNPHANADAIIDAQYQRHAFADFDGRYVHTRYRHHKTYGQLHANAHSFAITNADTQCFLVNSLKQSHPFGQCGGRLCHYRRVKRSGQITTDVQRSR